MNRFTSKQLERIDGGANLRYWGPKTIDKESTHCTVAHLLAERDANCVAWANFLVGTAGIQGVTSEITRIDVKYEHAVPHNGH